MPALVYDASMTSGKFQKLPPDQKKYPIIGIGAQAFEKFGVSKSILGILWKSDSEAWVTRIEFRNRIYEVFGHNVEVYLEQNNLSL